MKINKKLAIALSSMFTVSAAFAQATPSPAPSSTAPSAQSTKPSAPPAPSSTPAAGPSSTAKPKLKSSQDVIPVPNPLIRPNLTLDAEEDLPPPPPVEEKKETVNDIPQLVPTELKSLLQGVKATAVMGDVAIIKTVKKLGPDSTQAGQTATAQEVTLTVRDKGVYNLVGYLVRARVGAQGVSLTYVHPQGIPVTVFYDELESFAGPSYVPKKLETENKSFVEEKAPEKVEADTNN